MHHDQSLPQALLLAALPVLVVLSVALLLSSVKTEKKIKLSPSVGTGTELQVKSVTNFAWHSRSGR